MGPTPKLLTDLHVTASMFHSFRTFIEADIHSWMHVYFLKVFSLPFSTKVHVIYSDPENIPSWSRYWMTLCNTDRLFQHLLCAQTTATASDIHLVLIQNRWQWERKSWAHHLCPQENKNSKNPETYSLSLYTFGERCSCCICVSITTFNKGISMLHQNFIVRVQS